MVTVKMKTSGPMNRNSILSINMPEPQSVKNKNTIATLVKNSQSSGPAALHNQQPSSAPQQRYNQSQSNTAQQSSIQVQQNTAQQAHPQLQQYTAQQAHPQFQQNTTQQPYRQTPPRASQQQNIQPALTAGQQNTSANCAPCSHTAKQSAKRTESAALHCRTDRCRRLLRLECHRCAV